MHRRWRRRRRRRWRRRTWMEVIAAVIGWRSSITSGAWLARLCVLPPGNPQLSTPAHAKYPGSKPQTNIKAGCLRKAWAF